MNRHDRRAHDAHARRMVSRPARPGPPPFDLIVVSAKREHIDQATGVPLLGQEPEHGVLLQVAEPQTWFTVAQADLVTNAFVEASNVSRAHIGDLRRFVADVVVDPLWRTEFFTGSAYWGRLLRTLDDTAWIVVERVDDLADERDERDARDAEALATPQGADLPRAYHRLDLDRAFVEGAKRWGVGWFDDPRTDARRYDIAVQLGLFGEVRYG